MQDALLEIPPNPSTHDSTRARIAALAQGRLVITVEEAGRLLCLTRSAAYRAAANGSIPALRISGRYKIPLAQFERWLLGDEPGSSPRLLGPRIVQRPGTTATSDCQNGNSLR